MPTRATVLLMCAVILFATSPAAGLQAASATDPKAAAAAFAKGTALFDRQDYVGAIEAFQQAYQLRPHFLVLCNIALSYERMGDMVSSGEHYRRCLDEGGDKIPDVESVRNTLQLIQERIAWAEVKSEKGGTVYLDGRVVGPAPQRVPMNPGKHVLEVRRPGSLPASASITARSGEEQTLELEPEPLPEPPPKIIEQTATEPASSRTLNQLWFWSSAGLTVAVAVVASVLGAQTLSIKADYEESPSRELLDQGQDRRLLTNVFWAVTAVAAGATTTLFFFTDFGKERPQAPAPSAAAYGLGVRGSF